MLFEALTLCDCRQTSDQTYRVVTRTCTKSLSAISQPASFFITCLCCYSRAPDSWHSSPRRSYRRRSLSNLHPLKSIVAIPESISIYLYNHSKLKISQVRQWLAFPVGRIPEIHMLEMMRQSLRWNFNKGGITVTLPFDFGGMSLVTGDTGFMATGDQDTPPCFRIR